MNGVSKLARGFACAVAALCAGSAVNAWADTLGEKTPLPDDAGWTRTVTTEKGTSFVYAYTNTATAGFPFAVPAGIDKIDYLVVGGGGGGGAGNSGGGGGAGGYVESNGVDILSGTVLTVVVGTGGGRNKDGLSGGQSKILGLSDDIISYGGGGGARGGTGKAGLAGASGGGGNGYNGTAGVGYAGGAATHGDQGYPGCAGISGGKGYFYGGGGGGAGGAGGREGYESNPLLRQYGGPGRQSGITGEMETYAIGGNGAYNAVYTASPTGYGSGGSSSATTPLTVCAQSGIVVIRYTPTFAAEFTWNPDKCLFTATCGGEDVTTATTVNSNATIVLTSKPNPGFSYATIPSGWAAGENGVITRTLVVRTAADATLTVPDPEQTGPVVELVDVVFNDAANATRVATVKGVELQPGEKVAQSEVVFVTATPNQHYEYATAPSGWGAVAGANTITNYIVAADDPTVVTIPEPTPIMVTVSVVGLENTTYVISTNGVPMNEPVSVVEGTEVTVTVTPDECHEYASAPTGWEKNADGSISKAYEIVKGMSSIEVPSEQFRIKQVAVTIQFSHTATCVVSNGSVAVTGGTVDVNATLVATIKQKTTPDGGRYIYESAPEGWTAVAGSEGTFRREYVASAPVTIAVPDATWVPSVKGNQIDNGDFEQTPTTANVYGSRYNWYLSDKTYVFNTNGYREAGINGDPLGLYGLIYKSGGTAYCEVTIVDRKASYKLTYRAKNSQSNQPLSATLEVDVLDGAGNSVFEKPISRQYVSASSDAATEEAWTLGQSEEFHFPSNGTYRIRFTPTYEGTGGKRMGFLDNVRLTMKPARQGLILLIK